MLKLGVNIDHVATLRQARYGRGHGGLTPEPDVVAAAREVVAAGAHSITVHLREDRRHIQDADVRRLRMEVALPLNLEMADTPAIVAFAEELRPAEVCLVPEKRQELTTEGGLNVRAGGAGLVQTVSRLRRAGIVVSLFIDADPDQIRAAAQTGADVIELHTGPYANATGAAVAGEVRKMVDGAVLAQSLGLRVNAGHGLNYVNTPGIFGVPHLGTLNIGHAIVARAVFVGLRAAVTEMLTLLRGYRE